MILRQTMDGSIARLFIVENAAKNADCTIWSNSSKSSGTNCKNTYHVLQDILLEIFSERIERQLHRCYHCICNRPWQLFNFLKTFCQACRPKWSFTSQNVCLRWTPHNSRWSAVKRWGKRSSTRSSNGCVRASASKREVMDSSIQRLVMLRHKANNARSALERQLQFLRY